MNISLDSRPSLMDDSIHCATGDVRSAGNPHSFDDEDEFNSNIWFDLRQSFYDCRYVSVIAVLIAWYLSYQITMAPYQTARPVLTEEQRSMSALVRQFDVRFITFVILLFYF